ncbi:hypothetical protein P692DRAFT_20184727 [Suillus brevipes Sb2]|nr:hypothetical protein P692DRAFT_20184727 [Suillus brevipes Sb2]
MRLNLPVYVWEIFGFGLAARYFVVHILEMWRPAIKEATISQSYLKVMHYGFYSILCRTVFPSTTSGPLKKDVLYCPIRYSQRFRMVPRLRSSVMAPTYLWSRQSWLSTSGQGHGNTRELGVRHVEMVVLQHLVFKFPR